MINPYAKELFKELYPDKILDEKSPEYIECDKFTRTNRCYGRELEELKKKYYKLVWKITMEQPLFALENIHLRGFKSYHIDHIYPISKGFKNGIPPRIIGNISNLRMLHHKLNMLKSARLNTGI